MYFRNIQEPFILQGNKLIKKREKFLSLSDNCSQYKSTNECLSHSNCGVCLKNHIAVCKEGDVDGPLFCGNCDYWKYKRRANIGKNKDSILVTTRPWNKVFKGRKAVDRIGLHRLGT